MSAPRPEHAPVLLAEVLAALALQPGDIYVDATLGAGGYLRGALAAAAIRAFGFDRDPDALALNADLAALPHVTLVHRPFADLVAGLQPFGVSTVDAIAFDIGVSSMQLDRAERGFSFQADGPLDMRMSQEGPDAADFVNTAAEAEIADVLFHLGDEPGARRIARAIVADRPFARTSELAGLIRRVLG
ncbi:MAG: 16S rRNA (cytosine(1402)-N(4))-methyltransferase, partial [Sphingomonadales bacterium]